MVSITKIKLKKTYYIERENLEKELYKLWNNKILCYAYDERQGNLVGEVFIDDFTGEIDLWIE